MGGPGGRGGPCSSAQRSRARRPATPLGAVPESSCAPTRLEALAWRKSRLQVLAVQHGTAQRHRGLRHQAATTVAPSMAQRRSSSATSPPPPPPQPQLRSPASSVPACDGDLSARSQRQLDGQKVLRRLRPAAMRVPAAVLAFTILPPPAPLRPAPSRRRGGLRQASRRLAHGGLHLVQRVARGPKRRQGRWASAWLPVRRQEVPECPALRPGHLRFVGCSPPAAIGPGGLSQPQARVALACAADPQ